VILPAGVVGEGIPALPPLGIGFVLLALVGWFRALTVRVRVAELFFPLYFGLILLWPVPWSGDRFSLPLLPLMFFYSAVALLWMLEGVKPGVRNGALSILAVAVLIPSAREWNRMAEPAGACREATAQGRWRDCMAPAEVEYRELAEWSGDGLPRGAVVTTRKPRIFFLWSGVKAQSIPLTRNPDRFMAQLGEGGSRYLSLDRLDGISGYYAYPVVSARLADFCGLGEMQGPGQGGTRLLGVLSAAEADAPGTMESAALSRCPPAMFGEGRGRGTAPGPWTIPLLLGDGDGGG
jgi:hypothetical protein